MSELGVCVNLCRNGSRSTVISAKVSTSDILPFNTSEHGRQALIRTLRVITRLRLILIILSVLVIIRHLHTSQFKSCKVSASSTDFSGCLTETIYLYLFSKNKFIPDILYNYCTLYFSCQPMKFNSVKTQKEPAN